MILRDALKWGEQQLLSSNNSNASMETFWILSSIYGWTEQSNLWVHLTEPMNESHQQEFEKYIQNRLDGMPLAYILKLQDFMNFTFEVNEHVLIPRSETEVLAQHAIVFLSQLKRSCFLDVGTGSGNIAISIAKNCLNSKGIALDISGLALDLAQKNARRYGVLNQIEFIQSDLFSNIQKSSVQLFDLIVSNPPYIKSVDIPFLQKEVQLEPLLALDGGESGLEKIISIIQQSKVFLKPGARLMLEVGYNQSETVQNLCEDEHYSDIQIFADQWGINRVVCATWRGSNG